MYSLITILIIIVCILLMMFVLVQNPKGGGLGAGFGGAASSSMGGVKQTTDFLEKATWSLAIALFVLSIVANAFINDQQDSTNTGEKTRVEQILEDE